MNAIVDPRPLDSPWPRLAPTHTHTVLTGQWVTMSVVDPLRDGRELFDALDEDVVWTHLAGRPDTSQAFIRLLQERLDYGWIPWVVRSHDDRLGVEAKSIIGMTSYLDISVEDARLEIGWTAYAPRVWGTPVNPECKFLLLAHAFDELRAGRVQLKTDIRNERSQRAIAGIGADFEGVLRRYQRRTDDTVRDTVMYSVTSEDWPRVRTHLRSRIGGIPA